MKRLLLLPIALALPFMFAARRPTAPPPPSTQADGVIAYVFARDGQAAVACMQAVADRESGDDPFARNPSGASGIFQLELPLHNDLFLANGFSPDLWWGPWQNAYAARSLFESSGIGPWVRC